MDKFEVLNRKLDMLFDMIIEIRQDMNMKEYGREIEKAKEEADKATKEFQYRLSDRQYITTRYDYVREQYNGINKQYLYNCDREETEML